MRSTPMEPPGSKLSPSLTRRFFLPIILLKSLLKVFKKEKSIRVLDDPKAVNARVDTYETYVNKLAHICDCAKGGKNVSAFAILQLGVIQYYFTSNDRDEEEYEQTSDYITDVLNTLGKATDEEVASRSTNSVPSAVFRRLLQKILHFNLSRIKGYIYSMKKHLGFCIKVTKEDPSKDARAILEDLERLQTLLQFAAGETTPDQFVDGSQAVIQALDTMYNPQFKEYLHLRTQNNTEPDAPWIVVGHSIGRLLSYYYDVDILFKARRQLPQLFEDFEVHWIPSASTEKPTIPRAKLDAATIIGKMWNEPLKSEYTKHAALLEHSSISLNAEITRIAKSFSTTVHAEVNLHAHVLRLLRGQGDGHEVPAFFHGIKYIGCSKPTCRLCELWFANHPSDVRVRKGHRNLYAEWRPADADGKAAEMRDVTLNRMIPLLRDEVAGDLRDRCATRSLNDSNDVPTNLPLTCTGTDVFSTRSVVDDLASMMGRMGMEDVEERGVEVVALGEEAASTPRAKADFWAVRKRVVVIEEDEEEDGDEGDGDGDDDGGGAKL